ncbi:hypothetical protein VPH35_130214 [Triticum aestivum]
MALRPGDASLRPAEDFVVVPATPEMQAESAVLSTNAAVAWLEGDRQDVSCQQVAADVARALGARKEDVEVVKHYPERFLIRFMHQHHCADAVSRDYLPGSGFRIFARQWRLEAHADNEDMLLHVRLCLEGVPLHAWNEYVATFLIGRRCSLDYIEPRSRRKEDTRDLSLWAWTADPSAIPKVKWLTLPARGHRRRGRRGLRHRVIIHLDLLEDHSKAGEDDDNPPPPDVEEFTWYRKFVDGTYIPPDRRAAPARDARRNDRRDDEDHDGRRGRDGARTREGWATRMRRSLSRNTRDRQREAGQDRSRDRSGGRRRAAVPSDLPLSASVQAVVAGAGLLRGSGSGGSTLDRAVELLPALEGERAGNRGRSTTRHGSPRGDRRRSLEAPSSPASPPRSPTSVLRPNPRSKRAGAQSSPLLHANPVTLALCSPGMLLEPLPSPARPPGFEGSPTPPLLYDGSVRRTPSPLHVSVAPAGEGAVAPLFVDRQPGILASPGSSPPRPPAARRKTLAGVRISYRGGLSLQCIRRPGGPVIAPVAKSAEQLVARSLGITKDGKDVTEATLDDFTAKFKEQLPTEVIVAMRDFFRLDDKAVNDVEDALIEHGGEGALEIASTQDDAVLQGSVDLDAV